MIDPAHIGYRFEPHTQTVEAGRLRFFARTIGETNPVYSNQQAARSAGYPDVLVPPTFLFCLDMDTDNPYGYLNDLGIELAKVLHGKQHFRYHLPAFAGDQLTFRSVITDIYSKKEGALEFLVRETTVHRVDEKLADLSSTIIVRHS
ncbi:MaoC family dehydratase N-terminal domain-containing protein [uncultured Marinobacter sp.]|mgnify:CR=1 FL=1|uniref:MaoC family dehydratase N-terminal domain-containing protein n=1 Tax=uncultured Marinobacter sp. TaxID=187379 RepID=UPI0030DDC204